MPTARPFARNTGAPIAGTEQVGNLAVGVPTAGFAATGLPWWNGPDEESGYVIATQVAANNQPTPVPPSVTASVGFWRSTALTDASFIDLAQYVSRIAGSPQTFATASDAKTWLNTNGYWTSYVPTSVVTNGLYMFYDWGDVSSYPGSGTTLYDLSGNSRNAVLSLSGASFVNAGNQSYINFVGDTSKVDTNDSSSFSDGYTFSVIAETPNTGLRSCILDKSEAAGLTVKITTEIGTIGVPYNVNGMRSWISDGYGFNIENNASNIISNNTKYMFTFTYFAAPQDVLDGSFTCIYLNGTLIQQVYMIGQYGHPTTNNGVTLKFGTGYGNVVRSYTKQYVALIYKRPLSASEVAQNYEFYKTRFGL